MSDIVLSKRQERRKKKGKDLGRLVGNKLEADKLIALKDGSFAGIFQESYVTVHTQTDQNGRTTTTYHYHSNDVAVVFFDKDGAISKVTKIAKRQLSVNQNLTNGYFAWEQDGNLNFLFNDSRKNYGETGKFEGVSVTTATASRGKQNCVVKVEVELGGGIESRKLMPDEDFKGFNFLPRYSELFPDENVVHLQKVKKGKMFFGSMKI